jgi:hypothetical protein
MPLTVLTFVVRGMSLELEADPYGGDHAAIYLPLALTNPSVVVNQQGTQIPANEWSLVLFDQASGTKLDKPEGSLGTALYRPPTAVAQLPSCVIKMEIKATHFSRILASANMGALASKEASITLDGVRESKDEILWDMRTNSRLIVTGISFTVAYGN